MEFLSDLWRYMKARKKYWLIPLIVVIIIFGVIIVLSSGSAIAPAIYTLF